MLGDEYWMPFHWCLLTIIPGKIGCYPIIQKLKSVLFDSSEAFGGYVVAIFWR